MDIDKFVKDNADKIEKIVFDSQGNVKEIILKDNKPTWNPIYPICPYYPEPYRTDEPYWYKWEPYTISETTTVETPETTTVYYSLT